MPEAECVLSCLSPYSSRFWKLSPKSFVQDPPWENLHADDLAIIAESHAREADPLED